MYITILGRQPEIGIAELQCLHGEPAVSVYSEVSALVDTDSLDFNQLGGSQKAGKVIAEIEGSSNWHKVSKAIVSHYTDSWSNAPGKITLGISAYGFDVSEREVQKTGILLKAQLKKRSVSLRLIPNQSPAHNTATSHHNKLGLSANKIELMIVRGKSGTVVIAESIGSQNITALAARDQARPKTDAFVGMLPPKLARIMVNMSGISSSEPRRILDPFCGTGVVLQEAALLGFTPYGSDLSEKMVDYSMQNYAWLINKYPNLPEAKIELADAMEAHWDSPIDAVVGETYLGQPFSAPPSTEKLREVRGNCNHIIGTFLTNLANQIKTDTPVIIAVPAWRDSSGYFTKLPFIRELERLGYRDNSPSKNDLLYYREDQVVARQILVLQKA